MRPVLASLAFALCLTLPLASLSAATKASKAKAAAAQVAKGRTFAEQRCAACHGVTTNSSSPNPESPTFEDIANRPGLTRATLRQFLRDSHNYPDAMNFTVERQNIDQLASYMLTLRRPGYKPSI